jgi:hypothetical protein
LSIDQLGLYNRALFLTGCRLLATLDDDVENRYVLDQIWDLGIRDRCLENGFWHHAMRTVALTYSPSVTSSFGYTYAFDKPLDLVRIAGIWQDQYMQMPLLMYQDDIAYWWCDLQTIYIRYISNDQTAGYDLSRWPQSFIEYFAHEMAVAALPRLKDSTTETDWLKKQRDKALLTAKSKDAMKETPTFLPETSWNMARRRNRPLRRPPYR